MTDAQLLRIVNKVLKENNDRFKLSTPSFLKLCRAVEVRAKDNEFNAGFASGFNAGQERAALVCDRLANQAAKFSNGIEQGAYLIAAEEIRELKGQP